MSNLFNINFKVELIIFIIRTRVPYFTADEYDPGQDHVLGHGKETGGDLEVENIFDGIGSVTEVDLGETNLPQ